MVKPSILETNLRALAAEDAPDRMQWCYDGPVLFGTDHEAAFKTISDGMAKLVNHMVLEVHKPAGFAALSKAKQRVAAFWNDTPFRAGTYRTDYVFDAALTPRLIEVTSRYPLNGYITNVLNTHMMQTAYPDHLSGAVQDDPFAAFFTDLESYLHGTGSVVCLRGDDLRNDSRFLTRAYEGSAQPLHLVDYRETDRLLGLLDGAFVICELSMDEICALPDAVLTALAQAPMINDPRSVFVVHDKAFFADIFDPAVCEAALGPLAPDFRQYLIPTYRHAGHEDIWEKARHTPEAWILKHRFLGKSKSIFAGPLMPPEDWSDLFDTQDLNDFVLQEWIPQSRLQGLQNGSECTHYVAGTLLLMNGSYYGNSEIRTCENAISNTGSLRKISTGLSPLPQTSFPGRWVAG